ncbi:hypothetical protein [Pseudalkalibacillus hwajinpoensis]|uniref:hypothetical protein n=1 Tax=Guptibacillus hwajinpoensis TaxID=208199 RepID=UPI001CD49D13|nr:hypothetical protein [Pseudalkalibacillus hwajinpoensis]MCA0992751.1 hypothetical protein [Pseudalkalibacillus hwajinpoensis]
MPRTSFASERTLEYLLVPKLRALLSHEYKVVPIYPWKQYEGNNSGKSSFNSISIKLFAFFPRRPKVKNPFSRDIEIKINYSLSITSKVLSEHNIPCIAGAPLISSLDELEESACMVLFNINGEELGDTYFLIDKTNSEIIEKMGSSLSQIISEDLLLDIIEGCPSMQWDEALKVMDIAKKEARLFDFNKLYGPRYKPIYFVLIPKK